MVRSTSVTDKKGDASGTNNGSGFIDVAAMKLSFLQSLAVTDVESRRRLIQTFSKKEMSQEELTAVEKMTFVEEAAAIAVLAFGVPGCVVTIPIVVVIVGLLIGSIWKVASFVIGLLLVSIFIPTPFNEKSLSSWLCFQVLRYFSFRLCFEERLEPNRPAILVAPPHGVFPFGNILAMMAFPSTMGFTFRGLASSAALRTPIFRHILAPIGVVDASRSVAHRLLKKNTYLGISTGGVAEVFETNSPTGDEVVLLQERKGMVKLAFQTGADLVPCYLFGNTSLYSLWTGGKFGHNFFRNLSRRIGFALIVFWGRLGLPIPYRIPIFGVLGKPIRVELNESPTSEDINRVHAELMAAMTELFDKHKANYGWGHKRLVIV